MQAREILNMPAIINMEIVSAQIELEHYKRLASQMEKCFVETSETEKHKEEVKQIIEECKKSITDKFMKRIEAEQKICSLLNNIHDERVKTALKYRYICLMSFDDIAEKMSYCTRQVRRFLEKGTEQIEALEALNEQ